MCPSYQSLQILQRNVGINLSAADLRMAQDRMNLAKVRMITEHRGGHRVAEGVRRHDLQYPAPLRLSAQELSVEPDTLYLIRRLSQTK